VPLPACPQCAGALTDHATHEQFQVEIPRWNRWSPACAPRATTARCAPNAG
jgi:hypothetical protein